MYDKTAASCVLVRLEFLVKKLLIAVSLAVLCLSTDDIAWVIQNRISK